MRLLNFKSNARASVGSRGRTQAKRKEEAAAAAAAAAHSRHCKGRGATNVG